MKNHILLLNFNFQFLWYFFIKSFLILFFYSFGSEDYNQDNSKSKPASKAEPPRRCKTPASDDEGRRKKFPSSSQYLTVDTQHRRQSTPMMWTAEDLDLLDQLELEPDKSPRVRRSSSFKAAKRQNSLDVPDDSRFSICRML